MEVRPNFIIPGAGRSGTTALASYLDQHPEVFISRLKEPNFFSDNYHLGIEWYVSLFRDSSEFGRFELLRYFTKRLVGTERVFGEASTNYLIHPDVPERIYRFNPEIKFVFMLRDPAERAYSSYKYAVQYEGLSRPFEEIIRLGDLDEIQRYFDIKSSLYHTNVSRFLDYFPKEQMLFVIFEEFVRNPEGELRRILRFLGVDESFRFDPSRVNQNAAVPPLSIRLQRLIHRIDMARKLDDNLVKFALLTGLKEVGNWMNHSFVRKRFPRLSPELREYMYREYFAGEVEGLENVLGRKLKMWGKYPR